MKKEFTDLVEPQKNVSCATGDTMHLIQIICLTLILIEFSLI